MSEQEFPLARGAATSATPPALPEQENVGSAQGLAEMEGDNASTAPAVPEGSATAEKRRSRFGDDENRRAAADWPAGDFYLRHFTGMRSNPVYGRSFSGIRTEPSAC